MINFRGVKKEAISEGVGVAFRGLLPGAPSKVGELCKTAVLFVIQMASFVQ